MYFDIETDKFELTQDQIYVEIVKILYVFHCTEARYKLSISKAHKINNKDNNNGHITKYSYHCVLNIACNKALNRFIAIQLNKRLKGAVDTGVYNNNGSLRLPGTCKIDNHGVIEDRKFEYDERYCFSDFVLTDISNCIVTLDENILFDNKYPIHIPKIWGNVTQEVKDYTLEEIKRLTGKQSWFIRPSPKLTSIITFQCKQSYKCFICSKSHDNDNLFGVCKDDSIIVNCYSNKIRYHDVHPTKSFTLN